MAYAVFGDIASEFKNITFSSSFAVTDAEVTAFIDEEEAIINTTISNRYVTPIEAETDAEKILKKITIAYVAYRVAKIINLKKDVPIPEKFIPQMLNEGAAFRIAKLQLADIQSGKIVLNDAELRSNEQGIKSFNAINNIVNNPKNPIPELELELIPSFITSLSIGHLVLHRLHLTLHKLLQKIFL